MTRAEVVARATADLERVAGKTIYADQAYGTDLAAPGRTVSRRRHVTFPGRMTLQILNDTRDIDRWTDVDECTPLYHVEPFGTLNDNNLRFLRTFTVHTVDGPRYRLDGGYWPPAWTLQATAIDMIRRHTKGQPR